MKFFVIIFSLAIASTWAAPQGDIAKGVTDAASGAADTATGAAGDAAETVEDAAGSSTDITSLLKGVNLQELVAGLPEAVKDALQDIASGAEKLLSGAPDPALNETVDGIKRATKLIGEKVSILKPVTDSADGLLDEAVANPKNTAALQNALRPLLQIVDISKGGVLNQITGSVDDLAKGLTGVLGESGKE